MVNIFTRKITDDLTSLVKRIDETVEKNKKRKMAAFVVLLSDDPDADLSIGNATLSGAGLGGAWLSTFLDGWSRAYMGVALVLAMLAVTLRFGRYGCSHLCPVGGALELGPHGERGV